MDLATEHKQYKSPDYKLLPFFHDSRDGWKVKAQDRNLRIKRLKNRGGGTGRQSPEVEGESPSL